MDGLVHRLHYTAPAPAFTPPGGLDRCLACGSDDGDLAAAIVAEPEAPDDDRIFVFAICSRCARLGERRVMRQAGPVIARILFRYAGGPTLH
jgi:hypothetical protein